MKDRPRALSVLVAVFLAGAVIGAAGSYYWLKPSADVARPFDGRRPSPPPPGNMQNRPTYAQMLDLTPEQDKQSMEIFAETRKKIEALEEQERVELFKKIEAIWNETNPRLRAVLNEEQKVKFDEFLEKVRERRDQSPRPKGPERPKENHGKPERPQSIPPE